MEESIKMNEEVTLDIQEIFNVLKRKRKLIAIITLLCGIVVAIFNFFYYFTYL